MAAVEPAADDKVVGDGDGVGVGGGLAVAVTVATGGGLAVAVTVATGGGLAVKVTVGIGATVDVGFVVGFSARVGDRVGLGIVAVAVGLSGRTGDRVGLGIVSVGVGREPGDRVGVTDGRSAPHEMSSRTAMTRPAARTAGGTALPNPDLVVTSPPTHLFGWQQIESRVHPEDAP